MAASPRSPARFSVDTSRGRAEYVRAEGLYALRGNHGPEPPEPAQLELEGGKIRVFEGAPPRGVADEDLTAVYRLGPRGSLAVPPGSVFVRFRERANPAAYAREIESFGFAITRGLPYAPHCAWVEPRSRRVGDALANFEKLRHIPEVEGVEPQLLMASHRRAPARVK